LSPASLPVDRLGDLWPDRFHGARVGALLHAASVTSGLRPTLAVLEDLAREDRMQLTALFGPQHGFRSTTQDNMIEWQGFRHPRLGIPVFSLYGEHRRPTPDMLHEIDVLLVDLVDVGSRYYTFIWTLLLCLQACAGAKKPVVVADRPNPITGVTQEGEPQRPGFLSFVGLHPLPNRHGRTIGELAKLFRTECVPDADVTVMPLRGWKREQWHDETGLPWVPPSPNMPSLDTATVYPGMCLLEGCNLSEGRGTTRPFEFFGAPWIDADGWAAELNRLELPGVHFRAASFEPTFQKHAGETCGGAQLHVTDRDRFLPVRTGLEILRLARDLAPKKFAWNPPPYEYEREKLPIEILCGCPVEEVFDSLPS